MASLDSKPPGPDNPIRGVFDSLLGMFRMRVELLSVELEEEKIRLVQAAVWSVVFALGGLLMLLVTTTAVVLYFWNLAGFYLLLGFGLIYGAVTLWALRHLKILFSRAQPPFEATLKQLKEDRDWLRHRD